MNEYELYHYGVPGMKWGIRKVKKMVGTTGRFVKKTAGYASKAIANRGNSTKSSSKASTTMTAEQQRQAKIAKAKKAVKVGAAVAATVLAVYGTKKLNDALVASNAEHARRQIERIQRAHDLSYQRYWLSQQRR